MMRPTPNDPPHDPWDHVAAARLDRLAHARRTLRATPRQGGQGGQCRGRPAPGAVTALAALAAGYVVSYVLRNVNAVVGPDIMRDLGLGPEGLGQATSAYFLMFAVAQLPVGILLDRVGPRRVQAVLMLCTAAGAALSALHLGFAGLLAGRALIGIGTAGALIAGLRAAAGWFPRDRLPTVSGALVMCGGLGALAATWPAEAVLQVTDWRGIYLGMAAAATLVACAIWLLVPDPQPGQVHAAERVHLMALLRDPLFVAFAPLMAATTGTVFAVQGLWAGSWLMQVDGLSRPQVAATMAGMAVMLIAGAPLWGLLARVLRQRMDLAQVSFLAAIVLLLVEALILLRPGLPPALAPALPPALPWCLFALFGSMTVLHFSVTADHFPAAALGRANALMNVAQIGCAFLVQFGIGQAVAWCARPGPDAGAEAYRCVILLPIALQLAALAWFAWRTWRPTRTALAG